MAVREGAAGPGGAGDPGPAPAPHRVADDLQQPVEARLDDVGDVQHLARLVSDQTVQVAQQVSPDNIRTYSHDAINVSVPKFSYAVQSSRME